MGADFYHCRLKVFGRGAPKMDMATSSPTKGSNLLKGRSAVACAAYRAGMALQDERYGTVRDFSRKSDVVTSFTIAPEGAPEWATDITQLWNRVEAFERRKDAQLAYEWEVALPNELDPSDREAIARSFAGWLVDEYGVAVTVGIHDGGGRGNGLNDHMHVMMTRRGINDDGFEPKILSQFSINPRAPDNPEVSRVREHVADLINEALDDAGSDTRVDHRSFKTRGIDREPTRHLGPAATAYERQGYETERGNINRDIIEARLAWQLEDVQPQITADLEREFSGRYGDALPAEFSPEPTPANVPAADDMLAGLKPAPESYSDHLAAEPQHQGDASSMARSSPWGGAWRMFSDRARALGSSLQELWDDETSGRPEGERSLAARLIDAGRHLWTSRTHRDGAALVEGMEEAAAIARDFASNETGASPPATTDSGDGKPQTWVVRVREQARQFWHNERGSVPSGSDDWQTDFDGTPEQWVADTASPETSDEPQQEPDTLNDAHPDGPEPDGIDIEP